MRNTSPSPYNPGLSAIFLGMSGFSLPNQVTEERPAALSRACRIRPALGTNLNPVAIPTVLSASLPAQLGIQEEASAMSPRLGEAVIAPVIRDSSWMG